MEDIFKNTGYDINYITNTNNNKTKINENNKKEFYERKIKWLLIDKCPDCGHNNIWKYQEIKPNREGVTTNYFVIKCLNIPKVLSRLLNHETPKRSNPASVKIEAELCNKIKKEYINKKKCGFASWYQISECPKCKGCEIDCITHKYKTIFVCSNNINNNINNNILNENSIYIANENDKYVDNELTNKNIDNEIICGFIMEF